MVMMEASAAPAAAAAASRRPVVAPRILQSFTNLVDKDCEKRVSAALHLVRQTTYSQQQQPGKEGALCWDAQYALNRLVRGLASSRPGARQGFFTALTHLLRQLPDVSTEAVVAAASAQLPDVQGDKRQGTEHRLGRLLAAGALVRAGRVSDDLATLTATLLKPWKHRSYMPPIVASFIVELVPKVTEASFAADVWPRLRRLLEPGWSECTPERLWMLLTCRQHFPNVCDAQFLKQHWGSKRVFSAKSYENIVKVIQVSACTLPEIHPLVTATASLALTRPDDELVDVCQHVLEPLLADRTSALLAMAMLQMIVPQMHSVQMVGALLTPAVVGALVRLLPKRDQQTERAARGLGSALVSLVLTPDTPADVQMAVLSRLVQTPSSVNFDFMTGTKIVAQMINGLKAEALEPFAEIAIRAASGISDHEENLTPRGRAVACDMLCRLVQHPSTPGLTPLKQRLLEKLFSLALLQNENVSDELAATALRAFYRALEHPVRRLADLTTLLRALTWHQACALGGTGGGASRPLRAPLSAAGAAAWDAVVATLRRLETAGGPETDVFVILLGHLSQQLFGPDSQTAMEALQELHVCLERQQHKKKKQRRSTGGTSAAAEQEPHWTEVVTDLLLMLLSLNVHLLRSVVRSVFTLLAPQLSREAVLHVFQSLRPDYRPDGPGENGDADDSEEGGESSDDESGHDDDDAESVEESEEEEAESAGEEEEEAEGMEKTELDTLRSQVKAALGDESDDAGSIDMDDVPEEHFAKVDAGLAAAFKAMRRDRRGKRGAKQTDRDQALMHFRIRVLDLADVYARVCGRSAAALELLPAQMALLSQVGADRLQAPLADRLRAGVGRVVAASGRVTDAEVTTQLIAELLTDVLHNGARLPAVSMELGGLLSGVVRFLVRTSAQLTDQSQTPVVQALQTALDDFFNDRECVYPQRLFAQLLQLPAWPHSWKLVPAMLRAGFAAADNEVRLYRRTQALQLVTNAARSATLVAQAPAADIRQAALTLWRGLQQVLSNISSGEDVKSKYVCSSLEALAALRQAVVRMGGVAEPPAAEVATALAEFLQRVPVGKAVRRLANQLGASRAPSDGDAKLSKKQRAPMAPPAVPVAGGVSASLAPAPAAAAARPAKRAKSAAPAAAEEADRDGSVDSGVAEEASDVEAPPGEPADLAAAKNKKKKKRRKEAGGGGTPVKRARV